MRSIKRDCACLLVICLFLVVLSQPLHAAPLNLGLRHDPDIMSSYLDINYYAGTGDFIVDGFATPFVYDYALPGVNIYYSNFDMGSPGTYSITASIDNSGNLNSGSLAINGYIDDAGGSAYGPGLLLSGNMTDFGFWYDAQNPTGTILEFEFEVTGGALADVYGGVSALGGALIYNSGFTGSFASDFNNNFGMPGFGLGDGYADTAALPEPASIGLLLMGLMAARLRRR